MNEFGPTFNRMAKKKSLSLQTASVLFAVLITKKISSWYFSENYAGPSGENAEKSKKLEYGDLKGRYLYFVEIINFFLLHFEFVSPA